MISRPVTPVIISGGAGSRLWPLSRAAHPKQFIALVDGFTLLQATARRLAVVAEAAAPIVVCNEAHRFMVSERIRAVGVAPAAIVLEPVARGSAPAIAAAALEALARRDDGGEPILLVLPVDHVIRDEARFAGAVRDASVEAASGRLVTFGVRPVRPETGYGYIRTGPPTGPGIGACRVDRFVEKPDARTAASWIEDGRYFWNSGMFVFGAGRYMHELGVHAPEVRDAAVAARRGAVEDLGFVRLDAASFARSPAISVDHAVMERTAGAVMVPLDAGWSDIGSWASLADDAAPTPGRRHSRSVKLPRSRVAAQVGLAEGASRHHGPSRGRSMSNCAAPFRPAAFPAPWRSRSASTHSRPFPP